VHIAKWALVDLGAPGWLQLGSLMIRTVFAIVILAMSLNGLAEQEAIDGFFGQRLGKELAEEPMGVFKLSRQNVAISYVVPVPASFPIDDFRSFVALVDAESGLVRQLQAMMRMPDVESCMSALNRIDALMAQKFAGAKRERLGDYRAGSRGASARCGGPWHIGNALLSVRIDDFDFNRELEDHHIRALLELNE
jgi:hypothetical protein